MRLVAVLIVATVVVASPVRAPAASFDDELATERAACVQLAAQGRRREAIASCDRVLARMGTARDFHAAVVALVGGPEAPTPDDLARATFLARAAVRAEPRAPWGYLAHCRIAIRWGDPAMIDVCTNNLKVAAPMHEETTRWLTERARLPWARPPWTALVGWGLFALTAVASILRLSSRRRARRRRIRATTLAVTATLLLLSPWPAAHADPTPEKLSTFAIDDANPEASVPDAKTRDAQPLQFGYFVQDLVDRAEKASKSGDHTASARYYRAIVKAVPDRAIGFSKLCDELEAAGDRARAIVACRAATLVPGVVVADNVHLARLLLAAKGEMKPDERKEIEGTIDHLRRESAPEAKLAAHHLSCELGLRDRDAVRLAACTEGLRELAPNDAQTITFSWTLAVMRGDRDAATKLVERARAAGLAAEGVAKMTQATAALSGWSRWMAGRRLAFGALLLLAIVGAGLLFVRRTRAIAG